jgi:hypothetical protein
VFKCKTILNANRLQQKNFFSSGNTSGEINCHQAWDFEKPSRGTSVFLNFNLMDKVVSGFDAELFQNPISEPVFVRLKD